MNRTILKIGLERERIVEEHFESMDVMSLAFPSWAGRISNGSTAGIRAHAAPSSPSEA